MISKIRVFRCLTKLQILIGLLYVVSALQTANAYCIDNWACFDIVESESTVDVYLINKKDFPITSTIRIKTQNLRLPDPKSGQQNNNLFEQTRVLKKTERIKVLSLISRDKRRSYRIDESFYWTPGNMDAEHDDSYQYSLPFAKDNHFRVVQGYGGGYSHRGASKYALDFDMPVGTPIHAARGGIIIDLTEHHTRGGASRKYARYANFVTVLHSDGTTGEYYHLRKNGVSVSLGEKVQPGDHIGYSGNTGFSSMPHLHFAVYRAKPRGKYESLPIQFKEQVRMPNW